MVKPTGNLFFLLNALNCFYKTYLLLLPFLETFISVFKAFTMKKDQFVDYKVHLITWFFVLQLCVSHRVQVHSPFASSYISLCFLSLIGCYFLINGSLSPFYFPPIYSLLCRSFIFVCKQLLQQTGWFRYDVTLLQLSWNNLPVDMEQCSSLCGTSVQHARPNTKALKIECYSPSASRRFIVVRWQVGE